MAELGRILIADGDKSFLNTTVTLLRHEGYECACAMDARTVAAMFRVAHYDLLIADAEVAGSLSPELIEGLAHSGELPPMILTTVSPSPIAAVQSVRLPVVVRLIKPFKFSDLLIEARRALAPWSATQVPPGNYPSDLEALIPIILRSLSECLETLKQLTEVVVSHRAFLPSSTDLLQDTAPEYFLSNQAHNANEMSLNSWSPNLEEALRVLSPREQEILRRLCARERVPTIARSLYISPHTVRNHLKSIFRKLGVNSQIELLARIGQGDLGQ
jgi:DNA-binding NarL/FixJ family response regulator